MTDWAHHVTVPVFLSGALQDEQTGPQWPALINAFPKSTPVFANMVNGDHIDSADPQTISRWLEFLDLYVADKVPTKPSAIAALVLDQFAAAGRVGILGGAAPSTAVHDGAERGRGQGRLRQGHATRPGALRQRRRPDRPRHHRGHLHGELLELAPGRQPDHAVSGWRRRTRPPAAHRSGHTTFSLDPSVRPRTSLPANGNAWLADPGWDWTPVPSADGVGFATAPFTTATTIVGPATLDLWVKAGARSRTSRPRSPRSGPRPRQEEYVTSGFLRSTNQVDDAGFHRAVHRADLSASGRQAPLGEAVRAREDSHRSHRAHLQAGNRAACGDLGSRRRSSRLDLRHAGPRSARPPLGSVARPPRPCRSNVVHGVAATPTLPACGALRGEPCRALVAEGNQAGTM